MFHRRERLTLAVVVQPGSVPEGGGACVGASALSLNMIAAAASATGWMNFPATRWLVPWSASSIMLPRVGLFLRLPPAPPDADRHQLVPFHSLHGRGSLS